MKTEYDRKWGLKSIIWIVIFIILLSGFTYLFRPDGDNKKRFAGFYYQNNNSIQVIYIGASPVFPYWASTLAWNEYGFTSWPLATSVQQPLVAKYLIKECLKTQMPKVIIIDLRMFSYTQEQIRNDKQWESWTRAVVDNMKLSGNRIQLINKLVKVTENRHYYYFDLAKYHSLWKNFSCSDYGYWDFERNDLLGGNQIHDDVIDFSGNWYKYNKIDGCSPMPREQEMVLRDLLNYCKGKQLEILFTVNPYVDITEEKQKVFNYMKRIIVDEYDYGFINFNNLYDELDIDFAEDFYNDSHMNTCGAVKFTRYLADYLVKNYELDDKRGGYWVFGRVGCHV